MNRQFTINDVFVPGITGGEPDRVRQAFHAPDLLSGSEIGQRDHTAEQLGMTYGQADAGWDDASTELKIRKAETVPGADKWVQDAPENVAFLSEDAEGLMAVYQSLVDTGILNDADVDRETVESAATGGHGVVDTLEIGRLANQRRDIGAAVLAGSMDVDAARAQLAELDQRMAMLKERRGSSLGFHSFLEQMYRMGTRDLPQAGYRALEGALAGATTGAGAGALAGTAVPVLGNLTGAAGGAVAGGVAGFGAGMARGMYESAQAMETANMLADLLSEKDDLGNYLDLEEIKEKAQIYGMGSALVESAGDLLTLGATKLIAPFIKTAVANVGEKGVKLFAKDAIANAVKNKQSWPVMRRFLLGMGAGAGAEGAEEAVQEGLSSTVETWLKNSLNESGKNYFRDPQKYFTDEMWDSMLESGVEGAKVGAWFVLLPGIAQLFVDAGKVREAKNFEKNLKVVSRAITQSKTGDMAPARLDTFLQSQGLNQTVYIPADAAWQMQSEGTDLVTPLGWTKESLEEAASMGHDIAVPLSRLFARLDESTRNAIAPIVRQAPGAMNAFEAEDPSPFLQDDVAALEEAAEEWAFEQDMLDADLERVRASITEAVRSVPALMTQLTSSADPETAVSTYVDSLVKIIEQASNRLRAYGDDARSVVQKLNFEGLIRDVDGRLRTAEEIQQRLEDEAMAEADRPFWDNVWGRLDADSLKRDFPDARRELARAHGSGLFAKKGEGIAVDELADMLKNAGWLEQDADSSTLVETLKSKKRPKARKAGKAEPALRQGSLRQKFDASPSAVVSGKEIFNAENPFPEKMADRRNAIIAWLEQKGWLKSFLNAETGWNIAVSKGSIRDTSAHGMDEGKAQVLAALPDIIQNGVYVDNGVAKKPGHKRYIFASKVQVGETAYVVGFVVDEDQNGKRFYNHELTEIENLDGPSLDRQPEGGVTEAGQGLSVLNVIKNKLGVNANILFQFIGEAGAARLDRQDKALQMLDRLTVARSMEKNGESPARIKLAVGWERGADGLWRYELDDSEAEYRKYGDARLLSDPEYQRKEELWGQIEASLTGGPDVDESVYEEFDALNEKWSEAAQTRRERVESNTGLLSDILYHPTLFKAYPRLADIPVTFEDISAEGQTVFIPQTLGKPLVQKIVIREGRRQYASDDQLLSILMHEVQHVIQNAEDFAMGGSTGEMSFADYRALAGEVEARNTQKRLNMSAEEREESLAAETEDVAREDQLIIWDGLAAFSEDTLEQRAWHGTPHRFSKFTLDHIGTGEGSQAHGWGLYFARDKDVAEGYRERYRGRKKGQVYEVDIPENDALLNENASFAEQPEGVQRALRAVFESFSEDQLANIRKERLQLAYYPDVWKSEEHKKAEWQLERQIKILSALRGIAEKPSEPTPSGPRSPFMPHPADVYERSLNRVRKVYPEEQVATFQSDGVSLHTEMERVQSDISAIKGKLSEYSKALSEELAAYRDSISRATGVELLEMQKDGSEIYNAVVLAEGEPRLASMRLNEHGIKGITYDSQQDGRCFVVFDDQAIEVIDKLYAMQSAESHSYATGNIQRLDDGDFLIRLFRGANLSTLAHEISHAVHLEMERLDREGKGTPALKRDLGTLRRWQAKFDDDSVLRAEYDRYYKGLYGVEFDELDDVGKLAVKQRAQREMVARGFELYLREGESPTPAMEAVFRRMGKWMKRVYQNASQLDVEINDDVREVFDRWLASDEDIAAAAAANNINGITAPLLDALGLQGAERLEVEGMVSDAMGKAADALRRERARFRREHIQQWREEVEQELANDPVYQAREAMRRHPLDLEAVVDTYGQEMADALRVKLPATLKKGGENPEALAFDYGFTSAGQMIQAILNRPGVQERRKELLAQKVADADAHFAAEDFLFEQEELRQREDKVGEALYRLEMEERTAGGRPLNPSQQDFEDFGSADKNRWKIAREQLKTQVSKILDEKEAQAAINPEGYRRTAAKAMRAERRAILAKDWAEAVKQNYLTRLNLEAAYQAARRRDLVQKVTRKSKVFLKSATPDIRARFAVFMLSQRVGLFNPTMKMVQNAADKGMDDIHAFLKQMEDEGFYTVDAGIKDDLFAGDREDWKLMEWKDLQPYLEAMAVLMHMERESRKANSEAAKAEWREEMDWIATSILALNPHRNPPADQKKRLDILRFLRGVHASHLKAETIALLLDGDQERGPVWTHVILPINRATADRGRRMREARNALAGIFGVYSNSEWVEIRGKRITVPSLGRGLTKEQMLVVMLNAGNESNLERLRGHGYTDEQIRAIIDMLDERDVKFVQSVWDYLESFRKESFDLEEKLTGVRPQAIEAQPVQTRFGELRGGYYPVSYDAEESSRAVDEESIGTLTGSMMPAVDHGSMKQRTAAGLGAPLKLTLEVVPNHVAKTVHMLAFREPVRRVARVLNDKAVNSAIESTMGVEVANALKSWLHYVAGERPASTGWSRAAGMLRKNSALYSMGVKLTTMLAQMTGLLGSTVEIGPRWVLAGLVRTYCRRNPFTVYRETAALSGMMADRMKSVDRDLYEMSTGLMAKGSTNKVMDKFVKFQHLQEQYAFLPIGFVQMAFADLPTWQGAYAKALSEGRPQAEAIEYADAIVERTQVGGAEKDLAGVQRGAEIGKLMTQFYSYFSALYQLYARRMTMLHRKGYKDPQAWAKLGTLFLLTGVVEPVVSALLTHDEPEDDEDWTTWAAQKVFFQPWNMVVGLRDVTGAVESLVEGYGGKSRAASLLNDLIDTGVRFGKQIAKGEDMDPRAALKSGWKGVGLLTGFTNAQELLFIEAFWDWLSDTNPDMEWADLIRRQK